MIYQKKFWSLSGKNFIIDNKSCSVFYENIIKSKFKIIKREDPTYLLKAIKNNTEIDNMISSHVIDGVALTKFIYWIKKVNKKKITEVDAQIKLEKFRKKSNKYLYPSFETIAGAGKNGAIVHYRAKKDSCRTIKKMIFFYVTLVVSINMVLLMLLEPSVLPNQNQVSKIFTLKY